MILYKKANANLIHQKTKKKKNTPGSQGLWLIVGKVCGGLSESTKFHVVPAVVGEIDIEATVRFIYIFCFIRDPFHVYLNKCEIPFSRLHVNKINNFCFHLNNGRVPGMTK